MYLAIEFSYLQELFNFTAPEDTPNELKILMVRIVYIAHIS